MMRSFALSLLLATTSSAAAFTTLPSCGVGTSKASVFSRPPLKEPACRQDASRLFMSTYATSYYQMFGVSRNADLKAIKSAYRKLAKQFHPDANPGKDTKEIFQEINHAYEILTNPDLKRQYDIEECRTSTNPYADGCDVTMGFDQHHHQYHHHDPFYGNQWRTTRPHEHVGKSSVYESTRPYSGQAAPRPGDPFGSWASSANTHAWAGHTGSRTSARPSSSSASSRSSQQADVHTHPFGDFGNVGGPHRGTTARPPRDPVGTSSASNNNNNKSHHQQRNPFGDFGRRKSTARASTASASTADAHPYGDFGRRKNTAPPRDSVGTSSASSSSTTANANPFGDFGMGGGGARNNSNKSTASSAADTSSSSSSTSSRSNKNRSPFRRSTVHSREGRSTASASSTSTAETPYGVGGFGQDVDWGDIFDSFNAGSSRRPKQKEIDLGDIYNSFTGGRGGMGGGDRRKYHTRPRGPVVGEDLRYDLEIDFKTAASGGEETIHIQDLEMCNTCMGDGVKPGSKVSTCTACKGSGVTVQVTRTPFGVFQTETACPTCRGQGQQVDEYCPSCGGQGFHQTTKQITISIPAGVVTGNTLRVEGQGEAGPNGGPSGDLYIYLRVKPDSKSKPRREGSKSSSYAYTNESISSYVDAILSPFQNLGDYTEEEPMRPHYYPDEGDWRMYAPQT